jgi:acetyl esterase/lipase
LESFLGEVYARPDGFDLEFDLVHPGGGSAPLVVFLHGGGWISGDRTMYAEEVEWFVSQGFAAAAIEYRLAPLYPFPAAVEDAQEFLRFVRSEAGRFGIDGSRVAAFGNSAGGHLAAMLGVGYKGGERANAVVDVCGITDIRNPDTTQFPISMSFVEQFMGGHYVGLEQSYADASPLVYVDSSACPFLIVHGTDDDVVPIDQSRKLDAAFKESGVSSRLIELPGEGHSFTYAAWEKVREEAVMFLRGVLG